MPVTLLKIPSSRKRFRDQQKERRIFEHLTNEYDVITEDDIRNVRTDIFVIDSEYLTINRPFGDQGVADDED